ncbi:type II toxin-antitoxin system Phd/YefM family antitoxin [Ruania zhangjianzhongii]|uniref:type II toxin-antitoxin system Phd/YefM family antitoxin n=1 Tax=Ruania zhangjianzhongii TaxID=2603206 RepID=UPI0011C93B26|nr:type II toxin-antitoxin system prevent-host-death family antitoxin [Ruania zhangjianzhongii]
MESIPHRQLRNESSRVLARVAKGESFTVTNHGEAAAVIGPPGARPLDDLAAAGRLRPPRPDRRSLRDLQRTKNVTSAELLEDLRGDR